MLERHIDIYGRPPRQMAADGGYASGGNLKAAKEKASGTWRSTRSAG